MIEFKRTDCDDPELHATVKPTVVLQRSVYEWQVHRWVFDRKAGIKRPLGTLVCTTGETRYPCKFTNPLREWKPEPRLEHSVVVIEPDPGWTDNPDRSFMSGIPAELRAEAKSQLKAGWDAYRERIYGGSNPQAQEGDIA